MPPTVSESSSTYLAVAVVETSPFTSVEVTAPSIEISAPATGSPLSRTVS